MTKFNLKQLTLASGVFGLLLFLIWWTGAQVYPSMEVHRQLLLEMLPTTTWPLPFGMWFWAAAGSTLCGALSGLIFGLIFNFFTPKN